MAAANRRKPRPPLDSETLGNVALRYVERFATTRAKLGTYLARKIRERGWAEQAAADIGGIVERFSAAGYVNDEAYAVAKSRSLSSRGYGAARLRQSLRAAGVGEGDAAPAVEQAEQEAADSAIRFARRRRIGPFAADQPDIKQRQKSLAAMIRAGHGFALARAIVAMAPGEEAALDALLDDGSLTCVESV
ncbi:MAG: recombination regulator RecX [Pseudomonadota bacterium]|nr:recombination regulator RecX [Pseudomonadota bacterium]